jgi:hypothetical protein
MVDVLGLAVGLATFGVVSLPGLFVLWIGYAWHRIQTTIESTEETDPDTVSPGLAKVTGPAKPVEGVGTIAAPLTGTESLAYEVEVLGYSPDADGDDWYDMVDEDGRRQFRLEGTTESPVVDPEKFDLMLENSFEETVKERGEAPPTVQSYVDDHDHDLLRPRKTRFIERRLEPGEQAYVVGQADRSVPDDPDAGARTRIWQGPDSGLDRWLGVPRIVSDQSESAVLDQQGSWAKVAFGFGAFWLLLSLFFAGPMLVGSL